MTSDICAQIQKRLQGFAPGTIVQHFKRTLLTPDQLQAEPEKYTYEIIGVAQETETDVWLMVYRARYGDKRLYARPLELFLSETDREKYPQVTQGYRFEPIRMEGRLL